MSDAVKTIVLSAAVSVIVSSGTVLVYNALGEAGAGPGEGISVSEGGKPEVIRLSEALEAIGKEVGETRAALGELEARADTRAREVEKRVEEVAGATEKLLAAQKEKPAPEEAPANPEERFQKLAESFGEVASKLSFNSYGHPDTRKLVEEIRALGDEGIKFLADALLESEDIDQRFLAGVVAEQLHNPALIPALERSALGDENFIARRMSAHALAFLKTPEAGDSLLRILQNESRDSGVRLNAWYGIAELGRPEAVDTFRKILDEVSGDLPVDFAIDTALKVSRPDLNPVIRLAYGKEGASIAIKIRILRTLGKSEFIEDRNFVAAVAADPAANPQLRQAAEEALRSE